MWDRCRPRDVYDVVDLFIMRDATVVKMVDFSYKPSSAIPDTLPLGNAGVPTVQDGSARDSHPGTPS